MPTPTAMRHLADLRQQLEVARKWDHIAEKLEQAVRRPKSRSVA